MAQNTHGKRHSLVVSVSLMCVCDLIVFKNGTIGRACTDR